MPYCVYKLENDKGELYFGMTKNANKRWHQHMSETRMDGKCSSKRLWYDDTAVVGMEELEMFDTKEEAHEREIELIQHNNCVNAHTYDFNKKAYREKNKEEIKEYYQKNKEQIAEQRKQKIVCDNCGLLTSRGHIARHKKSAKCKSHLSTE